MRFELYFASHGADEALGGSVLPWATCHGLRNAVLSGDTPRFSIAFVTAAEKIASLSWMRKRCEASLGSASRSCWITQLAVGCSVTLKWRTRRQRQFDDPLLTPRS